MIINYVKNKYVKEEKSIEVENPKNIFLKGTNPYDGLSTYFGIWTNKKYLMIVTLISGRCISYEYSLNKQIYTEGEIRKYLEDNKNVKVISKNEFEEKLKNVLSLFKI